MELHRPTKELVEVYGKQWEQIGPAEENAIRELLKKFPDNRDYTGVLLKSMTINTLYATQIRAIVIVAKHICELNIDKGIKQGDPQIVDRIARVTIKDKERRNYAFATKYCSFHNPYEYPIYDSYVDKLLRAYQKRDRFYSGPLDLKDYRRFKEVLKAFLLYYELGDLNAKELDKFLWGYGKEMFGPVVDAKSSKVPISVARVAG